MSFFAQLINLRRRSKVLFMLLTDLFVLPLAFYSAVALREGNLYPDMSEYWWLFFFIPVLTIPIFIRIGLYRAVIRYMDVRLLWTIFYGTTIGTLLITALVAIARINSLPRSSLAIFWVFASVYVGATRLIARGFLHGVELRIDKKKRVAIYGAGRAGTQMAQALLNSREYTPVLFLDDSIESQRSSPHGLRVFSPSNLDVLIPKKSIDEILVALPSVARSKQKEIIEGLRKYDIVIKILPAVADVVSGKVRFEDVREVQIEDLLGRDQVPPRLDLLKKCIENKVICVTGAGGSIGSELCRQVINLNPSKLILIELNEFALYQIEKEITQLAPHLKVLSYLLDVSLQEKMTYILKEHQVKTIYHAAAYKHVPLVEMNAVSGILNNSIGTKSTALAAINAGVDHFILISTDKAVRPTNVMGASKRLAELVLQALACKHKSNIIFSMVRFGNVLGSSGSVVPLFREQIKRGGPITVTHPDIIRYFMTIPEASLLVIQAGSMATGGEVFVLDMGEPIKIVDLARRMIKLSGLEIREPGIPLGDIEIQFTGLRPGEKLYEELLIGESATKTDHLGIMMANEKYIEWEELDKKMEMLLEKCQLNNPREIKLALQNIVKEYQPQFE
ncbi:MAG: nucleoside-diphosphate sugar epimerase/dehydratase [Bacteriovorax sp.]|nr:nucleoside-diphosphate sugar epimerase/dehydratase [Bacteriovorax sp.]